MALPAPLQALFDRLQTYNGDPYNAASNPGGLARGGNQNPIGNFIKLVRDLTAFGKGIAGLTSQAEADAVQTAGDRIQTGKDRAAAAGSAEAAARSEASAVKAFDDFDDRYLGAKAADPAKDNDGNDLIVGALYFSTALASMRVWNGAGWQAQVPAAADYALKARKIDAGTGLKGGGDLSADRTIEADIATQAEAVAGTSPSKLMTAQRVAQAVAAQSPVSGIVFISQQTVGSPVASVAFVGFTNAFDEYLIEFLNIVPSSGGTFQMRTSTDGGATFDAGSADYRMAAMAVNTGGVSGNSGEYGSVSFAGLVSPIPSDGGISGYLKLVRPASSAEFTYMLYETVSLRSSDRTALKISGAGYRQSAADVDALQFFFSGVFINSGHFKMYGLRKS